MATRLVIGLLLFLFPVTVDAFTGSTSAGAATEVSIGIADTLSMRITQLYFKFNPSSSACALVSKKSKYTVHLQACSNSIALHSANEDFSSGSNINVDKVLECPEPSSWSLVFQNENSNCRTDWKIEISKWSCSKSALSKSSGCRLRYKTTPHQQTGPIIVGTEITSTIEVIDDPYWGKLLKAGVSSTLNFNPQTSLPLVINRQGTSEIKTIITSSSVGVTQYCVDMTGGAAVQYINSGDRCTDLHVYAATDAPPTLVPTLVPTDAPPTLVPTAVPTNIPETDAPPTLPPTNIPTAVPTATPTVVPTAVPTSVPTNVPTAVPTMIPTAKPIPETLIPTTVSPTSAPPTQVPGTSSPPEAVAFGTGTTGGSVSFGASVGSLVAGSGAGGTLSKTMVIANQMKCTDGYSSEELPFIVHPLIFAIQGNYWAGAVVGNIALCLASYAFLFLLVQFVKRKYPDRDITIMMRYPGIMIPASLILYPSILQYAGSLVIYTHTVPMKIIGVIGLAFSVLLTAGVMTIFRCDHNKCAYRERAAEHFAPLAAYALGCGAWEDSQEGSQYVAKMGTSFDVYCSVPHLRGHYFLIEYGTVPFLTGAAWISTNNNALCTVRIIILFIATFVQMIYVWKIKVYIAPLLTHLHCVTNLLISVALIMELISVHGYDGEDNWADTISTHLMTGSVSLVLLRCAYDCLQYVVDIVSGYKSAIIKQSHTDTPQFQKESRINTPVSDLMIPLVPLSVPLPSEMSSQPNMAFQNMEYNLLHCKLNSDTDNESSTTYCDLSTTSL